MSFRGAGEESSYAQAEAALRRRGHAQQMAAHLSRSIPDMAVKTSAFRTWKVIEQTGSTYTCETGSGQAKKVKNSSPYTFKGADEEGKGGDCVRVLLYGGDVNTAEITGYSSFGLTAGDTP